MRQLKSDYDKKIKELHQQVQDKAIELQSVTERVDSSKKREKEVEEHILKLRKDLSSLSNKVLEQAKLIQSDREQWQKDAAEHDKKIFEAKNAVKELENSIFNSKKEVKELEKVQAIKTKLGKDVAKLEKEVEKLSREKSDLSTSITLSEKELQENQGKKADLKKLAGSLMEEVLQMHRVTQTYRNHIYFYIRRIVQWYKEKGRTAPKVFDSFHPNVPIREDILKKLKKELKQKHE